MTLLAEWKHKPLLKLIHTAANAGRLMRKAKALPRDADGGNTAFKLWLDQAGEYCCVRYVAVWARAEEVAQLARLIGLPECAVSDVENAPLELAVRVDNLIRTFGHSCMDEEEEPANV